MSFSISVKDYSIGAGETLRVHVPGTFFQLMEATSAVDVSLVRAHSIIGKADAVPLGFSVGPLNDADAFDGVEIYSATAQTVKVCIARGAVDLRSITQVTGTVQVINGEIERVKAGQSFVGRAAIGNAAATFSHGQLYNPATSGKNIVLSRVTVHSSVSTEVLVGSDAPQLSTLVANSSGPKLIGGAAPQGQMRVENNAAYLHTDSIGHVALPVAMETKDLALNEPFVVPPGYGLTVIAATVNTGIWATFQWFEEAV